MRFNALFGKFKNIAFKFRAEHALICAIFLLMASPILGKPAFTDEKAQDIVKDLKDSKFFRETFFYIVNRDEKKVPFIQNEAQAKYYREKTDNDLILKARHIGFSSEIQGDDLVACMNDENTNAVMMAHTMDDTLVHRNRIDYYLDTMGTLDYPMEVTVETDNVKEVYFPEKNSYYWTGTAGSKGFGRGRQITRFHGSEVAHWPDQAVLTAVLNARSLKAKTRLETTANGIGEKFHELWYEAEDPAENSPYKQHFFAWWMDPLNVYADPLETKFRPTSEEAKIRERVQELYGLRLTDMQLNWWRHEKARQADKNLMNQEHPSWPKQAFLTSGRHVFTIPNLEKMEVRVNEPVFVGDLRDDEHEIEPIDNPEGALAIWKLPREDKNYFIPADIAEGVKDGAFNVAPVFDRASWEVVAEARLRCNPGDFGRMMCTLGEFYYWAILCPEMNNHGHAAIEAMKNWRNGRGYPHILKTTDLWPDAPEKLGWPTDERTKEKGITALQMLINKFGYVENSKVAIGEMMAAVRDNNGRMVSERAISKKGLEKKRLYLDCVMTRVIAAYCLKFITLDDSYRESQRKKSAVSMVRIAGRDPERGLKRGMPEKPWRKIL